MGKALNLRGQRFGRLTALHPTEKRGSDHSIFWECQCDCGNICEIISSNLRSKITQSCGCLQKERTSKARLKHGLTNATVYYVWCHMLQRCENLNNAGYKNYGGRGIKVCDRWHKFENFYEDVGDKPEGLTFDRWPNNDGNYEPKNWRWATRKEQSNNRRNLYWFFAFNFDTGEWSEDNNQSEFAKKHNLNRRSISLCLSGKRKFYKNWIFEHLEKII